MSKDYYKILGVEKGASATELKKAFHKMAHQYHPDKNGGDDSKFKEVNEAYQVLSNPQKKAQYDQFGSTGFGGGFGGTGAGQGFSGFDFSGFQQGQNGNVHFEFGDLDLGDIFSAFTGGGFGQRVRRGRDFQTTIRLTFEESIFGVNKKITVADPNKLDSNKEVEINIPAGVEAGQQLRLQGYGEQIDGGQPGSLYVRLMVEPHKIFRREGRHLVMDMPVKISEALLGDKREVDLLDGKSITVKIPKGLQPGQILRVKGKGVPVGGFAGSGDLLIRTIIQIPDSLDKRQKKVIEDLAELGL